MFYFLSDLKEFFFAFNVLKYITFRAAMAAMTTFLFCIVFGPRITQILKDKKFREYAKRDDCPGLDAFVHSKQGVPTMGGIFIIGSIVISILLWGNLANSYVLLTLLTSIYLAVLGFIDDYTKLICHDKKQRGLPARTKLLWQILLGFFIGSYVYFNPATTATLSVPFFKHWVVYMGVLYLPFVALIVIGTTNAVNLTDGLDGLAAGCIFIVSSTLGVLCYLTGHIRFSEYLFIPYIPGAGELTVFCAAVAGACMGFLWFNCHPATVFMGDTGSLSLGGTLAVIAVLIQKEILLVLLGGVFVIEALSVILQVGSFKLRKKRIFKMSPLHHHLQLSGWDEAKIIVRFWIIGIIFAILTLITLKVR